VTEGNSEGKRELRKKNEWIKRESYQISLYSVTEKKASNMKKRAWQGVRIRWMPEEEFRRDYIKDLLPREAKAA